MNTEDFYTTKSRISLSRKRLICETPKEKLGTRKTATWFAQFPVNFSWSDIEDHQRPFRPIWSSLHNNLVVFPKYNESLHCIISIYRSIRRYSADVSGLAHDVRARRRDALMTSNGNGCYMRRKSI